MTRPLDMLRDAIGQHDFMSDGVEHFLAAYQACAPGLEQVMLVGSFRVAYKEGKVSPREALFICGYVGGLDDIQADAMSRARRAKDGTP